MMYTHLFHRLAVYSAPATLPLGVVMISRLVVWASGVAWTDEIGGPISAIVLIFGVPAGAGLIAIAHLDGWFR